MSRYSQPTSEAIDAEVTRLQPRYEAFMRAQGVEPDAAQLREWAAENLREQIILETEAKAAKKTVDALMTEISEAVPEATVEEARAEFRAHPEQFIAPERVHAKHIVIHREGADPAEAMKTLLNLRADINAGKITWEEAVEQTSSCPGGDDLGFFPRGEMVEEFENVAFNMEEDTVSDVVESPFGWHLIRVESHLPEEPMLFEEAKDNLMASMTEARRREALETYVDERKKYFAE